MLASSIVIILSGFLLYALLKPPAEFESCHPSVDESYPELKKERREISEHTSLEKKSKFSK